MVFSFGGLADTLGNRYNGFAYGLLFLYLDGVFEVFVVNNGLSYIGASLTYLNFCVGKWRETF